MRAQKLIGIIVIVASGLAQAAETKTAEQVYQNITALKGTPSDQVVPAMQFIASALGVECTFCHVQGKMEADDKPAKKTAREMIAMTASINKASFGGRVQVSCYSCHRGATRPVAVPPVLESDAAMPKPEAPGTAPGAGATAATVDQILTKYVAALGGAESLGKVSSRVQKGMILANGSETPIEVVTKAPNKRVTITHMGASDSFTAYDGSMGWMGNTGRPAREMSASEAGAFSVDAEFGLALRLKEVFPQLRRGRPETVQGVQCEVLNGSGPGRPAVRLYFDAQSGLLLRMVRFAETSVGRNPTQIDYSDYREVDGVKFPFQWTLARPNGRFTVRITEAKNNVPVDDARFVKPAAEVK